MSYTPKILGESVESADGNGNAVRVARMVGHHAHACAARERLALLAVDREADKLHRADPFPVELAAIEEGLADAGAVEGEVQVLLEADQLVQGAVARSGFGELEHQRGGELARRRQEIAVRLDLAGDVFLVGDALRAQHFLDLIGHGSAILECQRGVGTDLDATKRARRDGARSDVAAPALVIAELENLGAIDEVRAAVIRDHAPLTPSYPSESSPFWKRPACDFSARASVSNQSAISAKPSSRAVRAMPGYMLVYSCVSPAIAALRLAEVAPIGRPVAGSPLTSRNSR